MGWGEAGAGTGGEASLYGLWVVGCGFMSFCVCVRMGCDGRESL